MSAVLKMYAQSLIHQEIQSHSAWCGKVSGLTAEKTLRNQNKPYVYVLRAGENDSGNHKDYYVSFVLADLSIKHQPFDVTASPEGWYYENSGCGGPYADASIEDVLHLIMHCEKEDISPLVQTR